MTMRTDGSFAITGLNYFLKYSN